MFILNFCFLNLVPNRSILFRILYWYFFLFKVNITYRKLCLVWDLTKLLEDTSVEQIWTETEAQLKNGYRSDRITMLLLHVEKDCVDVLNLSYFSSPTSHFGSFWINTVSLCVGTTLALQGNVALNNLVTLKMTFCLWLVVSWIVVHHGL